MHKKIIAENFQILRKRCPFQYWKPPGHQKYMIKVGPLRGILYLKQVALRNRKEY
jgi:hypothetical protein